MSYSQLKSIKGLSNISYAETEIPNRDTLPTHPAPRMKKSSKIPKVEDQTSPHPRVDPDEESKYRVQKLPSPIQTTPPSAATRKKYTKNLEKLVKQRHPGHYRGSKYDLPQATHCYNNITQGTRVDPTAHHIQVLEKNLQGYHQENVVIDPTTGASLEHRHIVKGPTKAVSEFCFANEIIQLV